jgi:hypothetical protein
LNGEHEEILSLTSNLVKPDPRRLSAEFAKAGRSPAAERLFRIWLEYRGRPLNACGEALFLLSCWRNGHSKDEIIHAAFELHPVMGGVALLTDRKSVV